MARIRSVHPGLWTDEAFVSVSPLARLLAIGLWGECDDQGAFEWKPITLKMKLLPVDNVSMADLLAELQAVNVISIYEVEGRQFGAVRNFARFQRPKKPNLTHPMPPQFRTYAGHGDVSSEPDSLEAGASSELGHVKPMRGSPPRPSEGGPIPKKAEIGPQMEDGGGRREKERAASASVTTLPVRQPPLARDAMARAVVPPSPMVGDPPEAWLHLADRTPDGLPKVETEFPPGFEGDERFRSKPSDIGRPCVAGSYLDVAADKVCEAARINTAGWRGDWRPLIAWLRDGIELSDIVAAVQKIASRPGYAPPSSLRYFDAAIRDQCRAVPA